MIATTSYTCNICGEESTRICARCTKDTCNNHLCDKCARCSDCCECEVPRDESIRPTMRLPVEELEIEPEIEPEPEPKVEPEPEPPVAESSEVAENPEPPEDPLTEPLR